MATKSTDCICDRIIITNPAVPDFTGSADVFRFDIEYGLTVAKRPRYRTIIRYTEFWCNLDADPGPAPGVVGAMITPRIAVGSSEYDPAADVSGDGKVTRLMR